MKTAPLTYEPVQWRDKFRAHMVRKYPGLERMPEG